MAHTKLSDIPQRNITGTIARTLRNVSVELGRARIGYDAPAANLAAGILEFSSQADVEFALTSAGYIAEAKNPLTTHWAKAVEMIRHIRPHEPMPSEFKGTWPHERLGHPTWTAFVEAPVLGVRRRNGSFERPPGLGMTLEGIAKLEDAYAFVLRHPEHADKSLAETEEASKKVQIREKYAAASAAGVKITRQQLADEVGCSRQYVHEVLSSNSFESKQSLDGMPPWIKGDATKAQFRKLPPAAQERVRRREVKVQTAAREAGVYIPPTPAEQIRKLWQKLTTAQRHAFLRWVEAGKNGR